MTEPDLYGLSLADVSRQVDRHWEVSQFFILLNMSVVGGAIALIGLSGSRLALVLGMIAFLGGIGLSAAGVAAGWQAKKYYRVAIAKKTLLEAELGLTGYYPGREGSEVGIRALGGLATRRKVNQILDDPDKYVRGGLRWGSISGWSIWTLIGIAVFNLIAAIAIALQLG